MAYTITEMGKAALAEGSRRAKAQMQALEVLLHATEPLDRKEAEAQHISGAVLQTLAEKGWALRTEKRLLRNSYDRQAERKETLQLTEEQAQAVAAIKASLDYFPTGKPAEEETDEPGAAAFSGDAGKQKTETNCEKTRPQEFLLQGITGSGKTEVYLRAADHALRQGKQVLVLVPEIALTAQIVQRFQAWFGQEVAVAHSKLSQNERGDVWYKMRTGEANVLIGVRSGPGQRHAFPGILFPRGFGKDRSFAAETPSGQFLFACCGRGGYAGRTGAEKLFRHFPEAAPGAHCDGTRRPAGYCAAEPSGLFHLCHVQGLRGNADLSALCGQSGVSCR